MATGGDKAGDFYAVLGLDRECSAAELRNAYKKLALRWHPDRLSAGCDGDSKFVEQAKEKFQEIQAAYSVLSDSNKRFLYDVGIYDSEDDDDGMGEFLGEMAEMMSRNKPNKNGHESLEELQQLFVDMFQADLDVGLGRPSRLKPTTKPPTIDGHGCSSSSANKRCSSGKAKLDEFGSGSTGFCFGSSSTGERPRSGKEAGGGGGGGKRRSSTKQKVSSKHHVSSRDAT